MNPKKLTVMAAALAALLMSPLASAYDAGDWLWRFSLMGSQSNKGGDELAPGGQFDYTDLRGLQLQFDYMLMDNLALGLSSNVQPANYRIFVDDGSSRINMGKASVLPLTLQASWYLPKVGHWRSYLIAAWQYNHVVSKSIRDYVLPGVDTIKVNDSNGPGAGVGLEWDRDGSWSWNLSALKYRVRADIDVVTSGSKTTVSSAPDPLVWNVGIVKRF